MSEQCDGSVLCCCVECCDFWSSAGENKKDKAMSTEQEQIEALDSALGDQEAAHKETLSLLDRRDKEIADLQAELARLQRKIENLTGLLDQSNNTMESQRLEIERITLTWTTTPPSVGTGQAGLWLCEADYGNGDIEIELHRRYANAWPRTIRRWAGPIVEPQEPSE